MKKADYQFILQNNEHWWIGYRKFDLTPLANVVLLDSATYRAIFEATIGEASSYSSGLSYIHLETLAEAIYRPWRARDIQSVRSTYSQDNLATPDLPTYFTITALCNYAYSPSLPWSRINTYTYQRWSIREPAQPVGLWRATHDRPKSRPSPPPPPPRDNQFDGNLTGGRKYRGRSFILVRR